MRAVLSVFSPASNRGKHRKGRSVSSINGRKRKLSDDQFYWTMVASEDVGVDSGLSNLAS